ncbi:tyrosine-protein kinase Dnt-like isoform X2 [Cloeon dipterum]|uniref:tyrosine-protein kinase Dnt-like isoform X2 n=1 Tax=Cloeon dipterum TaxID=197152 RepID=UPI003220940E
MWKHVIAVLTATSLLGCHGSLNLFISKKESVRLLGLASELYYIRDGVVNQYALKFNVPVPANFTEIYFTWRSNSSKKMPYSLSIDVVSNQNALDRPTANITTVGFVPTEQEIFKVVLPCTGNLDAEVDVNISINVTSEKKTVTAITLMRKKFCLQRKSTLSESNDLSQFSSGHVSVDTSPEASGPENNNPFIAAAACAFGLLVFVAVFLSICCARNRNKSRRQDVIHDSRMIANSQLTGPLLHPKAYTLPAPVVPTPSPNNFHHGVPIIAPAGSSSAKSGASSYASYSSRRQPSRHHESAHSVLGGTASAASVCQVPSVVTSRDDRTHDITERINELTIQRCRVRLKSVVQEGTFGRVYLGSYAEALTMKEEDVLVKTVVDQASQVQINLLLQEGTYLYALTHQNLLAVRGVSLDENIPLLIYPYKGHINLKRFLLNCRHYNSDGGMSHMITTQKFVDMGLQVNAAMRYLHRKQIIHKDIAARNCMIDGNFRIQIADNALARDLFPMDYHCLGDNDNRPIKWMAIEALNRHEFTTKSDMWAFGVLLWEIVTLAQAPYSDIDPFEMSEYLEKGYRLAHPLNCPNKLFDAMAFCWLIDPQERPSATQMEHCLQELYNQLTLFV